MLLITLSTAKAMIIPATNLEKYNGSTNVIEGEVMSSESKYDDKESMIITEFRIKIFESIYGDTESDEIILRVMGGEYNGKILVVTPNDEPHIGDIGVFFLNYNSGVFSSSFLAQSFVPQVKRWTKQQVQNVRNQPKLIDIVLEQNRATAASSIEITGISPNIISGGNGQILTITGSGFGASGPTGSTRVWFKQNNGSMHHASYSNPNYYTSWSDSEIKIRVPEGAGTGPILVGSTSNNTVGPLLTVKYSVRERELPLGGTFLHPRTVFLPSDNMPEGIKFHVSNTFDYNNPDHETAAYTLRAALHEWNCETQLNELVHVFPQVTNTRNDGDNLNVIFLDNTMGANVLGVTFTTMVQCGGLPVVTDTDVGFNANINWNFSRNPSATDEYDLYHTALHEFGHMRNMGHAINPGNIMYPSATIGIQQGVIDAFNVEGGQWVQNESNIRVVCSYNNMVDGVCGRLDVEDNRLDSDVSIHPNPSVSLITIQGKHITEVVIIDFLGNIVLEPSGFKDIDISDLPSGLYHVKINHGLFIVTKKLIIH